MARMTEGKETWHRLLEWDRGQASAERLAAIVLKIDGYQNIDPSHPLGGKDGIKDIVFIEQGEKWIAGVYFPRGQQPFKDIKKKFSDDFKGVEANQASGFIFITNQELRLAERETLRDTDATINIQIYHLERISTILNTPPNYGVRLDFLDIEMSKEEQLAFFAGMNSNNSKVPILTLKGILNDNLALDLYAFSRQWTDQQFMQNNKQKIKGLYKQISAIAISENTSQKNSTLQSNLSQNSYTGLSKYTLIDQTVDLGNKFTSSGLFSIVDAKINPDIQKQIIDYCANENLGITDTFFQLGNLKKSISAMRMPFGSSKPSLTGTDQEQTKYNLLMELYGEIDDYNEIYTYFSSLQSKFYLQCVVSNTGTSFDEDITVKLLIPKGCICNINDLPIPGFSFISMFNENSLEEELFMTQPIMDVDRFSNYPPASTYHMNDMQMAVLMQGESALEEYERYKETYMDAMEQLFCYNIFANAQHDILSFNIPYLKQNTNMSLPSILVFNNVPEQIEFEIRSKHLPDIVKGKIKINLVEQK